MAHWAADYETQLESKLQGTGWSKAANNSDEGPVVCKHTDGSELSMVNSSITGMFAIEYLPAEGTRAFKDNPRFGDLDNAMEMFEHILTKHESDNYN